MRDLIQTERSNGDGAAGSDTIAVVLARTIKEIVDACLQHDPAQRLTSVQAIDHLDRATARHCEVAMDVCQRNGTAHSVTAQGKMSPSAATRHRKDPLHVLNSGTKELESRIAFVRTTEIDLNHLGEFESTSRSA